MHLGGKLEVTPRHPLKTRDDLSMAYTPGVARVCRAIADDPTKVWTLTIKQNTVAVVTDGTAVLGLGDIGPEAALPVMEGKAVLFKEFGNIDAWPVCLATKDVDEIVRTVVALAPVFGGINLEDISAPRCFEVERRLREELDIPVFHDDQHGTAIVTLAAFINALQVVGKRPDEVRVVVSGVGAAGTAVTKAFLAAGVRELIGCDREGALYRGRPGLSPAKTEYAALTNPQGFTGTADEALVGADVFLGLSSPGAVSVEAVRRMAPGAIVFAMANPTPEVMPEEINDVVAVIATGRSDYPNQINNVLAFPGVFRGALDVRAPRDHARDGARGCGGSRCRRGAGRGVGRLRDPQRLRPARRTGGGEGRRRRGGGGWSRAARSQAGGRTRSPMKGVAVVASLRPGAAEQAASLIELGPPFELSQTRVQRHTVFLAADTAVFVFEGGEPRALLAALAGAGEQSVFGAWESLLDGTPKIAREVYAWTAQD